MGKYVSDKYAGDPNALIEVPKGGSFVDMVARGSRRSTLSWPILPFRMAIF
jgi:hypothetical protein